MSLLVNDLRKNFGFDAFRPGQEQTIQQLLQGKNSLAIFPTGSGKSLCYQLTALKLPHLTLVVSPLLALMKDQVTFLKGKGITAASLDSSLSHDEYRQVTQAVKAGEIKILMISVERFKNERFRDFIKTVSISMLVVDEAHCISEWGHNFRPDYLKLPQYKQNLNIPVTLLLTATATRKVKRDMAEKFGIKPEHIVQTGFYRSNLDIQILPVEQVDKSTVLLQQVQNQKGSGIVYVTLQNTAEEVALYLQQQGINASAYHAGFDSEKREAIQHQFMHGQLSVIVATIAFGMGIDKSDIRFVIHYDLPKSIENFSQEIGRAGRDGLPSKCITLANLDGLTTVENFVYGDTPEHSSITTLLHHMLETTTSSNWEMQITALSKISNIKQLPLKTLLVQLELRNILEPKYSYYADYRFKLNKTQKEILSNFDERRQNVLSEIFKHTKFNKIWAVPDLNSCYTQSGIERQHALNALEYLHEQGWIQLESKQLTEVYHVDQFELSQPGLADSLYQYFKDSEEKEINRIAAMIRFFELDQCLSHMLARYFDDNNSPRNCGHCSVCRGQVAKLESSVTQPFPDSNEIQKAINLLNVKSQELFNNTTTLDTQCRFLAGIGNPLLTSMKAKQISGYGICAHIRYQEIKNTLKAHLNPN
ncbi:MAG: RecQ family ATP-dependent DNA helicase [Gammaproteobacteria bacterium]|nr:RecQ family ATP-dependent DNA helicase [Gammaproteobacteria bacterium]